MAAAERLQTLIDVQQDLDALIYGIRSIEVCRSAHGASACHVDQIAAACRVAGDVLGSPVQRDNATLRLLKMAKRQVSERAQDAKDQVKAIGNKRQLRLALGGA